MLPRPRLARVGRDLGEGGEEGGQVWTTGTGLGCAGRAGVFGVVFDYIGDGLAISVFSHAGYY